MPTVGGDIIMASGSHLCSFPELHSLSDAFVTLQPQVPASALSASYSMSQWHLTQFINYSLQRFFFLTSRKSHFQFSFYLSGSSCSVSSSCAPPLSDLWLRPYSISFWRVSVLFYSCPYFPTYSTSPNLLLKLQSNHFWLLFCCSVAKLCLTLCDPMDCSRRAFLSFTILWSLLKLMSIESAMPFNNLILCHSSSCPQSLSESRSLLMSRLLTPGGQSIEVSVSASVLAMNIQGLFPLGLTG